MREFNRRAFLELAAGERITHALLVPAMYGLCLLEPDLAKFDFSSWRLGVYGSAPMPEATIRRFAEAVPHLVMCNAYGATETTSPATIMPPGEGIAHSDSIGKVVPCGEIRVMDEAGREVPYATAQEGYPALVVNGVIAAQTVARAAPDGYTILIGTNTTHAGNQAFLKSVPYDPVKDFEPITRLGLAALLLCVNNDVPVKSVKELTAYAKANPGKLNFGAGTGLARLATEMYKSIEHLSIVGVPYKGHQAALTDLRGGSIQILFGDIALMQPQVKAGAVRGLAVSSAKRSATVPEYPTMQEAGVAGYELVGWIAAFAPAKTPAPIIKRLNEEMNEALADREFATSLQALGVDAAPGTPEQLGEWVSSETKKWGDLAKNAGIQKE